MTKETDEFYTFRGYTIQTRDNQGLTPSMEDYLEMIYRLSQEKGYTRMNDLAAALNVQPPSAHKMVRKLAKAKYLHYEKYGLIELLPIGHQLGSQLLERHKTLEEFLQLLGVTTNILQDTEKIEHSVSEETLHCIFAFVQFAKKSPLWMEEFNAFRNQKQP
jgi:DtxR family Mn-dependent transcriptional regulator